MDKSQVRDVVLGVLREVQRLSGRECEPVPES